MCLFGLDRDANWRWSAWVGRASFFERCRSLAPTARVPPRPFLNRFCAPRPAHRLFTSPHLSRFSERIRIDGREVEGDALGQLDEVVAATGGASDLLRDFRGAAFLAFAEAGVDVAVLETAWGRSLDATTASHPLACAITSIALDHQDLLGQTIREIAHEKARIARPGVPLLWGRLHQRPWPSWSGSRVETGGRVLRAVWRGFCWADFPLALLGAHQASNAALAVALADEVAASVGRVLQPEVIKRGLGETRWPGDLSVWAADVLARLRPQAEGATALPLPASRHTLKSPRPAGFAKSHA